MRSPITLFVATLVLATAVVANSPQPVDSTGIVSHLKRDPVQSTALAAIGYSKRLRVLEIEFRNGAIYRYLNVDPAIYHDLMIAPSKARFYDHNVRRRYRSVHVKRPAK